MAKEIFRKKNLDKVNSPEDLNSYLRVTSPSLFIALGAAVILITGAVIWGTVSRIETKAKGVTVRENTITCCYINANEANAVVLNKTFVRANDVIYTVTNADPEPYIASEVMYEQTYKLGGFSASDPVIRLSLDKELAAGHVASEIVLKSQSPLEFLFKNS